MCSKVLENNPRVRINLLASNIEKNTGHFYPYMITEYLVLWLGRIVCIFLFIPPILQF